MAAEEPVKGTASFELDTPSKRLYSVVGAAGLLLFMLGTLLAIMNRNPGTDLQYSAEGIGQWCMLVGLVAALAGLFGSFLYDFTIRRLHEYVERLTQWIKAG